MDADRTSLGPPPHPAVPVNGAAERLTGRESSDSSDEDDVETTLYGTPRQNKSASALSQPGGETDQTTVMRGGGGEITYVDPTIGSDESGRRVRQRLEHQPDDSATGDQWTVQQLGFGPANDEGKQLPSRSAVSPAAQHSPPAQPLIRPVPPPPPRTVAKPSLGSPKNFKILVDMRAPLPSDAKKSSKSKPALKHRDPTELLLSRGAAARQNRPTDSTIPFLQQSSTRFQMLPFSLSGNRPTHRTTDDTVGPLDKVSLAGLFGRFMTRPSTDIKQFLSEKAANKLPGVLPMVAVQRSTVHPRAESPNTTPRDVHL